MASFSLRTTDYMREAGKGSGDWSPGGSGRQPSVTLSRSDSEKSSQGAKRHLTGLGTWLFLSENRMTKRAAPGSGQPIKQKTAACLRRSGWSSSLVILFGLEEIPRQVSLRSLTAFSLIASRWGYVRGLAPKTLPGDQSPDPLFASRLQSVALREMCQISAAVAISAATVSSVTLPVAAQVMRTVRSCAVGFQTVTASVPSSACQPLT